MLQAAEAEIVDSLDSDSDELLEELEQVKRAKSLSSIFNSEDDVVQVDAAQADESLAVCYALHLLCCSLPLSVAFLAFAARHVAAAVCCMVALPYLGHTTIQCTNCWQYCNLEQ